MSLRSEKLQRIAAANPEVQAGPGVSKGQLAPACSIHNRKVATAYEQKLIAAGVVYQVRHSRLCSRFYAPIGQLETALRVRDELFIVQPDEVPKGIRRDFDSLFLLAPFLLLAVLISIFGILRLPKSSWVGVLITGFSAMLISSGRIDAIETLGFGNLVSWIFYGKQ